MSRYLADPPSAHAQRPSRSSPETRHIKLARSAGWLLLVAALFPCSAPAQGRIVTDTLHSAALRRNLLDDTPDREVLVYLPPSYDGTPRRRYPVLYLLHGFTSHPGEWLDGSYQGFDLRQTMDSLAGAGATEYLVVMPDADNALGGTFYVNSVAFGRWEDFVTGELVSFVDKRYRTRPERHARGLAGQSMGGFGVLYLASRHTDTFASVYATSPCCLGFVGELAPGAATWRLAAEDRGGAPATMPGRRLLVHTMAAAFAPAASVNAMLAGAAREPAAAMLALPLPFTVDSLGDPRADTAVADAWRRFLPIERLTRDPASYRALCAIGFDAGRDDALANVPLGARAFSAALTRAGIRHTLEEFAGGHTDRARERFAGHLLPFFSRAFAAASPRC